MTRAIVLALLLAPLAARAASTSELTAALADKEKAAAALDQLVAMKQDAVPALSAIAVDGHDLTQRGWAIVGLRRIGGKGADETLARIIAAEKQPALVRTWAAAARIDLAPDFDAVLALAPLASTFPAVRRPLTMRVTELAGTSAKADPAKLIAVAVQDYQLQQVLVPVILAMPTETLMKVMLHDKNQQVRMTAASYLATKGRQPQLTGAPSVAETIVQAYSFQPGAQDVPWAGGPLYIPGIVWEKGPATQLVGELIRWYLWADLRGRQEIKQQINNNLNSLGLGNVVGYQAGWSDQGAVGWLKVWQHVAGSAAVRELLNEQNELNDPKLQSFVKELP
ncbi:MAG: hypothetical protein JST54_35065 [Deltaproteobacteria bacterium]|nr:hypothetical protein [Deltaproteobacteria bacterium]